ncbi:MAG TPA: 23S rRNA (pseudouridine(1915)-N(3))-methyltransferase RlmH [Burkholderiales bacterium]|nr:23S rRNA (pseudouridine(1915)-N(3))-methyltransferase RlmH [Burkholderiales bacterium]
MRLLIVAVGERMPGWVDEGFNEYLKRMPRRFRIELIPIRPEKRTGRTAEQCIAAEAQRIRAALPAGVQKVILDERGQDLRSLDLAGLMERWLSDGRDTAFLIGGPDGLAPELKKETDLHIRLSSMTLPHAMVRVLLAEQLYRAAAILDNHPYHRE